MRGDIFNLRLVLDTFKEIPGELEEIEEPVNSHGELTDYNHNYKLAARGTSQKPAKPGLDMIFPNIQENQMLKLSSEFLGQENVWEHCSVSVKIGCPIFMMKA